MTASLIFALTLIPAEIGFARNPPDVQQAVQAPADEKPDAKLLDLEKELTQEQEAKGPDRATPEQYNAFVARFREKLDETMGRVAPTTANQSVHARILVRLGDTKRALADLKAALTRDPKNPRLVTAKAYVLFDRKDYAASDAAAKSILSKDPTNQDALWLKHASEDRNAPKLTLPSSPWGDGMDPREGVVGGAAGASNDEAKPYTLAIKVGATAAPPTYVPSSGSNAPPEKRSPLVPLAATGVLLWIGAGLAARQAQARAVDSVEKGGEAVVDKAAKLAERGKELIEDHPYASGAAAVAGVLVAGVLAAPLILGGSGPTLLAAGAAGGGAPIAATAVIPQTDAVAGAATIALSVGGDAPKAGENTENDPKKPLTAAETTDLENEANSADPTDKGGKLTKAGRNLAKHAPREGSSLPDPQGSPERINQQARILVHDIFSDVDRVIRHPTRNWGEVIDVIAKSGRGIRYSSSGKFLYFLE